MENVCNARPETAGKEGKLVLTVPGRHLGRGDDETLGDILIRSYFHVLQEVGPTPDVIVFYNGGIFLTLDDSPVLEDVKALEAGGVKILTCGTCLNHFEVKDRLAVGDVSNMYEIAERQLGADRVVTL